MIRKVIVPLILLPITLVLNCPAEDLKSEPVSLVSIQTSDKKTFIGELMESDKADSKYLLEDLESGRQLQLLKSQVLGVPQRLTDDDAIKQLKSPKGVVAWRVAKLIQQAAPSGKIASISGSSIYTTLGEKSCIGPGNELHVYGAEAVIRDPDSGEIIGRERKLVAKLEVISVSEKISKTRLKGDLDVSLSVGDTVELPIAKPTIVVAPATDKNGTVYDGTIRIADDLIAELIRRDVKVVERSKLLEAMAKLEIEPSSLADSSTVTAIGKEIGVTHILTGSVVKAPTGSLRAIITLRLLNVATSDVASSATFEVWPFRFDSVETQGATAPTAVRGRKTAVLQNLKDVRSATTRGSWSLQADVLQNNDDLSVVTLPLEVKSGNYELSMDINRTSGSQAIFIWLPVGDRDVRLIIGDSHGLESVFGLGLPQNPTKKAGTIENGEWHRVHAKISLKGDNCQIAASIDGTTVVDWKCKTYDLSGGTDWAPSNKDQLGIAVLRSRVSFRNIEFTGNGATVK